MADFLDNERGMDVKDQEVEKDVSQEFRPKGTSQKQNRAFRVSPEEDALIERAVHLSGLTKQDFIIKRLQNKDIVVQGNPKVFKALKEELKGVMQELQRIDSGVGVDSDLLDTIRLIAITLEGMKKDDEWKQ